MIQKQLAGAQCAQWQAADKKRKCLRRRLLAAGMHPRELPQPLQGLDDIITFEVGSGFSVGTSWRAFHHSRQRR